MAVLRMGWVVGFELPVRLVMLRIGRTMLKEGTIKDELNNP